MRRGCRPGVSCPCYGRRCAPPSVVGTSSAVGAQAPAWRHKSAAAPAHCCVRLLPAVRRGCPPALRRWSPAANPSRAVAHPVARPRASLVCSRSPLPRRAGCVALWGQVGSGAALAARALAGASMPPQGLPLPLPGLHVAPQRDIMA